MHHPASGEVVAEHARRIAVFLPEMHRDEVDPDCRRVALDVDVMAGENVLGHPEPRHALGLTRGDAFRTNQDRAVRAPDLGALGEERILVRPARYRSAKTGSPGRLLCPLPDADSDSDPKSRPGRRFGLLDSFLEIWDSAEQLAAVVAGLFLAGIFWMMPFLSLGADEPWYFWVGSGFVA